MIIPSSRFLARALVNCVPKEARVLEIGAGTGAITMELIRRGWTSDRLSICEYDQDFAAILRERFPGYPVACADACAANTFLKEQSIDCVVSGLPLRNFSSDFKQQLIESLRSIITPGGSMVQYTYGAKSPLPHLRGTRRSCVLANIPPAFVWQYWFD